MASGCTVVPKRMVLGRKGAYWAVLGGPKRPVRAGRVGLKRCNGAGKPTCARADRTDLPRHASLP